jgi:hypothetical protein
MPEVLQGVDADSSERDIETGTDSDGLTMTILVNSWQKKGSVQIEEGVRPGAEREERHRGGGGLFYDEDGPTSSGSTISFDEEGKEQGFASCFCPEGAEGVGSGWSEPEPS